MNEVNDLIKNAIVTGGTVTQASTSSAGLGTKPGSASAEQHSAVLSYC